MKKRDYYILIILAMLVAFAAYYRTQYCSNIEAEQKEIKPVQETTFVPLGISETTDS